MGKRQYCSKSTNIIKLKDKLSNQNKSNIWERTTLSWHTSNDNNSNNNSNSNNKYCVSQKDQVENDRRNPLIITLFLTVVNLRNSWSEKRRKDEYMSPKGFKAVSLNVKNNWETKRIKDKSISRASLRQSHS